MPSRMNVFDYIVEDGRVFGAYAIGVDKPVLYVTSARAVLCVTDGAVELYRPDHLGLSRHKIWYPLLNTGMDYTMGIHARAEMTTLRICFIALRCRDTTAPTDMLTQGVGVRQISSLGEVCK